MPLPGVSRCQECHSQECHSQDAFKVKGEVDSEKQQESQLRMVLRLSRQLDQLAHALGTINVTHFTD